MQHNVLPTKRILSGQVDSTISFLTPDFNVAANRALWNPVLLFQFYASDKAQILLRCAAEVITAFGGTTPELTVGTSTPGANELLPTGTINEALTGFYPTTGGTGLVRFGANLADPTLFSIYGKLTQTNTTTGQARLYFTFQPLDVPSTPAGAQV